MFVGNVTLEPGYRFVEVGLRPQFVRTGEAPVPRRSGGRWLVPNGSDTVPARTCSQSRSSGRVAGPVPEPVPGRCRSLQTTVLARPRPAEIAQTDAEVQLAECRYRYHRR